MCRLSAAKIAAQIVYGGVTAGQAAIEGVKQSIDFVDGTLNDEKTNQAWANFKNILSE